MQTPYNPRSQQSIDRVRKIPQGISVQDSNQNENLWSQVGLAIARALGTNIDSRETSVSSPSETNIPWNYIATSLVNDLQKIVDSYLIRQEADIKKQEEANLKKQDADIKKQDLKLKQQEFELKKQEYNDQEMAKKLPLNITLQCLDLHKQIYKKIDELEREKASLDPNIDRSLSTDYWDKCIERSVKNLFP